MHSGVASLPLQEKIIIVQQEGISKSVPALDQFWVKDRAFPRYVAPQMAEDGTLPLGAQESWLEIAELLQEDITWLLQLPHHQFWSQIIFAKSPVMALTSFLQEAPPSYCQSKLPYQLQQVISELNKLVFLVYCRLSTAVESSEEFMLPEDQGNLLYDNYIFTVPSILDLCALFGRSNRRELERILLDVTKMQPKYLNDFSLAEPHLTGVLENADKMLSGEPEKLNELSDFIIHVYDSLYTMRLFFEIVPQGCEIIATPPFLSSVTSFYTSAMPKIAMTEKIKKLVDNLRIECLKIVRTVLSDEMNKAVETKSMQCVERYLTLVSEIMQDGLFICDYHELYPINVDFDIIQGICPDIDMIKFDYLLEALASHVDLKFKNEEEPKAASHIVNYPGTSQQPSANEKYVSDVELLSLITEVQDILPHLGSGFVEACLKYYDYTTERVVSAVLESSLPPHLEESTWDESRAPLPTFDRPSVFDYDELDLRAREQINPAQVHKGKKPQKYKNVKEMLNDKKDVMNMKEKFENLGFVEDEYDDEYDDTYESQDVAVREPDEVERRRAFVVPRVLRAPLPAEDEEEEDEDEAIENNHNKDLFIANPEEQRAKAEQRRADKWGHRDVIGKAKGQGQDKQVLINRDKKNVHKASSGNHHRRDRASRKRNQGMIPS